MCIVDVVDLEGHDTRDASVIASEVRKMTAAASEEEVDREGHRPRPGREDDPSDAPCGKMLLALRSGEALENGVQSRTARPRRPIDLTPLEGEGRRVKGDGQPAERPGAERAVGTLLKVGQEPGVDTGSFRQLLGAQAEFRPAMGEAPSQIPDV